MKGRHEGRKEDGWGGYKGDLESEVQWNFRCVGLRGKEVEDKAGQVVEAASL